MKNLTLVFHDKTVLVNRPYPVDTVVRVFRRDQLVSSYTNERVAISPFKSEDENIYSLCMNPDARIYVPSTSITEEDLNIAAAEKIRFWQDTRVKCNVHLTAGQSMELASRMFLVKRTYVRWDDYVVMDHLVRYVSYLYDLEPILLSEDDKYPSIERVHELAIYPVGRKSIRAKIRSDLIENTYNQEREHFINSGKKMQD